MTISLQREAYDNYLKTMRSGPHLLLDIEQCLLIVTERLKDPESDKELLMGMLTRNLQRMQVTIEENFK